MKKKLQSNNVIQKLVFGLFMILLCNSNVWSQHILGSFSNLDGGMENQTATTSMTTSGSTGPITNTSWTVSSSSAAATRTLYSNPTEARTGIMYAGIQQTGTATNLRLQAPTPTTPFASATEYTIQYWYKAATDPGAALTSGIYFNGTVSSTSSTSASTIVGSFTPNTWTKAYSTVNYTPASVGAIQWATVRVAAAAGVYTDLVNVDDFIVYNGPYDDVAADAVNAANVTSNSATSQTVSWAAPSTGVDGGGYVVVRYTSDPGTADDLNQNGIYNLNATVGSGTIVYIGTDVMFTDTSVPNSGVGVYYKIYTVDKAFNYNLSSEVSTTYVTSAMTITSAPALGTFDYVDGNGPSGLQSTVVTGTNLTNDIIISTLLTNYNLSTDNFATIATAPINLGTTGGTLYIRLKSGLAIGSYVEDINLTSGTTTLNITCTGNVLANNAYLGQFPIMDGGFENQVAGDMSSSGSSESGTPQTAWTVSSTANSEVRSIINDNTVARSGDYSAAFQLKSTATNVRLHSPSTLAPNLIQTSTPYTVQFFYKTATDPAATLDPGIYLNNTSSGVAGDKTDVTTWTANTWTKAYRTLTTGTAFNASHWAVARMTSAAANGFQLVNMDDFVVYGGAYDDIPADAVTDVMVVSNSPTSQTISWTAPVTGIDGGGYLVVRYISDPGTADDINQNGIYKINATIGAGTIVSIGTSESFTDNGVPNGGVGVYYKIYSVDKAFNYNLTSEVSTTFMSSSPSIISDLSLTPFNYSEGSGPSIVQSTVITGANLVNPITIATIPSSYDLSTDNFTTVATAPVNLGLTGGTLYVRLKAGLTAGDYNENIMLTSDVTTLDIAVTGNVAGNYVYNGSGSFSDASNWTPTANFTASNSVYNVSTGTAVTDLATAWVLGSGSKVVVASSLTIAAGSSITGLIDVTATGDLTIQDESYPTFGTLDNASTVHLQIQPNTNITNDISFGNLIFDGDSMNIGGSSNALTGTLTINGTLTVAEGLTLSGNSTIYNAFYFNTGANAVINGKFKHSRANGLVVFGTTLLTGNHVPPLQFMDSENVGVNFILGPNSEIEFSRGNSGTTQIITVRNDYQNLTISDGTSGANDKTVASPITIPGTLTINNQNASSDITGSPFVMGDGSTIVRTSGVIGNGITFGNSINVIYDGTNAISSGVEIPTTSSVLNNLEINNAGGVTLTSATDVNNKLTLTNGNLATAGLLTLKSNATKTAVVAPVTGTISGNVVAERHIPAGHRAYRLLSPTVTTSTSIQANWQEGGTGDAFPGFGTHLTGAGGATNGFDTTVSNAPSIFTHDNVTPAYNALANTSGTLTAGSPLLVFVRGSRQGSNITSLSNDAATIRTTGTLATGTIPVSGLNETVDGFSLVGNPYQAQVDMEAVLAASTNLNTDFYYVVDPSLGTKGAYLTVDVNDPATAAISKYVQPGQAFFVKTIAASSASLTFNEADKSEAEVQTSIFRNNTPSGGLNLTLLNTASQPLDILKVVFDANETNDVTQKDAVKLTTFDENMATSNGNILLAIEKRANPTMSDQIPLHITNYKGTSYVLRIQGNTLTETPYLADAFTGTVTEIPANGSIDYPFTVSTSDPATTAANRFVIVYNPNYLNTVSNETTLFTMYPNPSNSNSFNVVIPNDVNNASIKVSNLLGQELYSQANLQSGTTEKITVNSITAKGIYLVTITSEGKSSTTKWIVE